MRKLYVGFTSSARADAEEFLPEVKAPSNYKDPAKIAAYIQDARERSYIEASARPLTSSLASYHLLSADGTSDPAPVAPTGNIHVLAFVGHYDVLIGWRIYEFIRLARIDYIDRFGALDADTRWSILAEVSGVPFLEPSARIRFFDPVRAVVGSLAEDSTDPTLFVKRFKLKVGGGSAEQIARFSYQAARLLGE
jgi:hypothetical protein